MSSAVRVLGVDRAIEAEGRVERLVMEHENKLARYVRRLVGDREAALDLVQETFFAAYRVLRADPARPLTIGWLYKTATNQSVSLLRRRKRRGESVPLHDVASAFRVDEQTAASLDLQAALARLDTNQLSCIMLTSYAGYSSAEAALILGISADAVRQRVCRAMRTMRSALTA